MNLLNKLSLIFLLIGLFTACKKENLDNIVAEEPSFEPQTVIVNNLLRATTTTESDDGIDLGCLTIQYPFELLSESGNSVVLNSDADFEAAFSTEVDPVVDFVFPLTILDEKGNTIEVEGNDALGLGFASCVPSTGWETLTNTDAVLPAFLFEGFCFDLVYPVDLEDEIGNPYTANNELELIDLFATADYLFFSLPMTVVTEELMNIEIDNEEAFFAATFACEGITPPSAEGEIIIEGFGCNEFEFPFNVQTQYGEIIEVNDENEYSNLLLSGVSVELEYPFALSNENGILEINNEFDLIEALEECDGLFYEIDNSSCNIPIPVHILLLFNSNSYMECAYEINFPIELMYDGNVHEVNGFEEYFELTYSWNEFELELIYPISITLFIDGSTLVFNEEEELCGFMNECGY